MDKNILKGIRYELDTYFHQPADSLFFYGFLCSVAVNNHLMEQKVWMRYIINRGVGSWDKKNRDNVNRLKNYLAKTADELSEMIQCKEFSLYTEMWNDYCENGLTFASGFWEGMCLWPDFDKHSNNNRFHLLLLPVNTLIFPDFYAKYYPVKRTEVNAVVEAALRELPRKLYLIKEFLEKGTRNRPLIFKRKDRKTRSVKTAIFPFKYDIKPLS